MDRYWRRELKGASTSHERKEIRYLSDREEYEKIQSKENYLDSFNQLPDYAAVIYNKSFHDFVPGIHLDWIERGKSEAKKYKNVFDGAINAQWTQFIVTSVFIWLAVGALLWLSFFSVFFYIGIVLVLFLQVRIMAQMSKTINVLKSKKNNKMKTVMEYYINKQNEEDERIKREVEEYEEERTMHIEFVEKILAGDESVIAARAEKALRDYVYTLLFGIKLELGLHGNIPSVRVMMPMRNILIPAKVAIMEDKKKLELQPKTMLYMNEQYKNLCLSCAVRSVMVLFENIPLFENIVCNLLVEEASDYRRVLAYSFSREQIKRYCKFPNVRQVLMAMKADIKPAEVPDDEEYVIDFMESDEEAPEMVPAAWADCRKQDIKWTKIEKE